MNEQISQTQSFQQQETPPPNYLAFAIISTILCCQLFGIISIVYAASVNTKWLSGDKEGARRASRNAKTWAIVAAISGVSILIITALVFAFSAFFANFAAGGINM